VTLDRIEYDSSPDGRKEERENKSADRKASTSPADLDRRRPPCVEPWSDLRAEAVAKAIAVAIVEHGGMVARVGPPINTRLTATRPPL
jgi:hypothetical protein